MLLSEEKRWQEQTRRQAAPRTETFI